MATSADKNRLILIIIVVTLGLLGEGLAAIFHWGWEAAALYSFVLAGILAGYVYRTRDAVIGRLMLFGLVAGFGELLSDAFAVGAGSLVYPPEPLILDSPFYMPVSWLVLITQLGYFAWLLSKHCGLVKATLLLGVTGALFIPVYEILARSADFWMYTDSCHLVFRVVPTYVILGEFFVALALPALVQRVEETRWPRIIGLGGVFAIWTLAGTWLAYQIAC